MTECNMCGDCCEMIPLNIPFDDLINGSFKHFETQYTQAFIATHWKLIDYDREKYYKIWGIVEPKETNTEVFECDMFDKITRSCTAHDSRPSVCQGYPWYDQEIQKVDPKLPLSCSFWGDVPVFIRPKQVDAIL